MGSQKVDRGPSRHSRRERQLWFAAGGWLFLIYSTLYYVRGPIELLRERNLLHFTVAVAFLLAAATVTFFLLRSRPGWRGLTVMGLFSLVYLGVFLNVERAEEKLHFIEYGVLAGLIYSALVARRRERAGNGTQTIAVLAWTAIVAVTLTSALGWGDEGLQAILPIRVYDLRDVGLNFVAAVLAVAAIITWRWAQRRST